MQVIRSSEFAAKLGVNPSTISQAMRGPLKPARVRRGVLNLDHPCVADYDQATKLCLEQYAAGVSHRGARSKTETPTAPRRQQLNPEQVQTVLKDLPDYIRAISHLPLTDVIRRHGTDPALKAYIIALDRMESTRKRQLENRDREGTLVDRRLLTAFLGSLDGAHIDLLKAGAKTISRRAEQKTLAGETPEEIEVVVRELISWYLKIAIQKIQLALRAVEA